MRDLWQGRPRSIHDRLIIWWLVLCRQSYPLRGVVQRHPSERNRANQQKELVQLLNCDSKPQFSNLDFMTHPTLSAPAPVGQLSTAHGEAPTVMRHYVVFKLDDDYYALPLAQVARAVRMVAVTPAPDLPPWILGVINMAGQVLPVIDLRQRFAHPPRPPALTDRLLIARTASQSLALMVDEVLKVMEPTPAQLEAVAPALAQSQPLRATIREDERLILVLDAERLALTS